jgi:hypothetical protein
MGTSIPPAKEILEAVRRGYATCSTYQDSGTLYCEHEHDDLAARHASWLDFRTLFVRGSGFLFEFWAPQLCLKGPGLDRYAIWTEDGIARRWWSLKGTIEDRDRLELAIAAATGISHCTSHRVPSMLCVPEIADTALPSESQVRSVALARQHGHEFYRLEAEHGRKRELIWIERSRMLLWRIVEVDVYTREDQERTIARMRAAGLPERRWDAVPFTGERTSQTTTLYFPLFDVELDPRACRFEPPAAR